MQGIKLSRPKAECSAQLSAHGALFFALCFPVFLVFAHRACAAFLASSLRCSGVRAAMRAFTPLPLAAFPPFLPISRMTSETRSRRIVASYDG